MVFLAGALLALVLSRIAQASLYVTFPVSGSTCVIKQSCQIKWMDSSASPSTSTYGETALDLVSGNASNLTVVQALGGVSDPSKATAFTFLPNATLSPNYQYAVRFTPAKNGTEATFSTYFNITGGNATVNTAVNATKSVNSSSSTSTSNISATSSSLNQNTVSSSAKQASSSSASINAFPQKIYTLAFLMVCASLVML